MTPCAYCGFPLVCDHCRVPYVPPDLESFHALSWPEYAIPCPSCDSPLTCHHCLAPYDGSDAGSSENDT